MPEPTAASVVAFTVTGGGIVILGASTGLHPILLAAGFAGGLWAQLYIDELPLLRRLASIVIAALVGGWGSPAVAYGLPGFTWWPRGVPPDLLQFPLAMMIGLVSNAAGSVVIKFVANRGEALAK